MKPLEFTVQPTFGMAATNFVRGLLFLLTPTIILGVYVWSLSEARQYDTDGEIGFGTVTEVDQYTRRSRRGARSTSYTLTIDGPHGKLTVGASDPYAIRSQVRYIYSPTLQDAQLVGHWTERGDLFNEEFYSWTTLFLGVLVCVGLWMAYDQFRLLYVFATKNYVVVPS